MSDARPQFYRRWLGDLFPAPIEFDPVDCLNCHMVRPRGLTRDLGPFKASLKCCTFQPFLPSFTIGALLREVQNEESSKSLRDALEVFLTKSRLTRLGAIPRQGATSICETGKHENDRCPFLSKTENAVCTIRDHRPSTCAGYVCRSGEASRGFQAWEKWEREISKFESTLAHLAAFDLGWTMEEMDLEFISLEDAKAFYRRSYERARNFSARDFT